MIRETVEYWSFWFQEYFLSKGMNPDLAIILNIIITGLVATVSIFLLDYILRRIIIKLFKSLSNKAKITFDDYLVLSNFPKYIAHSIPLYISWKLVPILFREFPFISKIILIIISIYLIILGILVIRSTLRTTKRYLRRKEKYKDKPLDSYLQVLMLFTWGIGIFFGISLLTGYSAISFVSLGAVSAVILLIFKDTILGFVASIQISVNDIIRIGDWITFSKYGADGYVIEINLATVLVQNFDNTFTTIPTYSLIADSFQNWRGMHESDGRRIKRSIYIKQSSIKFLTEENIEDLKKIELIKPYLEHRQKDIINYNEKNEIDKSLLINGRNLTNLGVFRKYADALLHENPAINKDMFLMVRYLEPTDRGIPVEIFCFSYDKKWENYEHIQADILDHLLAAVPYLGLEVFELPSGQDFITKG